MILFVKKKQLTVIESKNENRTHLIELQDVNVSTKPKFIKKVKPQLSVGLPTYMCRIPSSFEQQATGFASETAQN